MIVNMNEILVAARAGGYAVGAFEFWSIDSARAVVEAAQQAHMPVILQAGPLEIGHTGYDSLASIARMVAADAPVEVALHLDHGDSFDMAAAAVAAGFTSVMIDASALPYEDNVELTCRVVEMASPHGVAVESELGRLAGSQEGVERGEQEAAETDPAEAARFVAATGIDALAVAIGTAHGFYKSEPHINLPRLAKIAEAVSIPLVLHGGSGIAPGKVRQAVALGIAKINICTEFIAAFAGALRAVVPSLFGKARDAAKQLALNKIMLFAGRL